VHVLAGGISTYAGTGVLGYTGDGGAATAARLKNPQGAAAAAANGDLYLADTDNNVIRKVALATGIITTVAGTGAAGNTGDGGLATMAKLRAAEGVAVYSNGDIYIADTGNHVIRKVTAATGIITTVAGTGANGTTGDGGLATAAKLNSPRGIQVAANGDLYIGDRAIDRIRKVTVATAIITAFAGTGVAGYSGDGGAATAAKLNNPEGLHLTSTGDLYIADTNNSVIRKVSPAGIISTFAGTTAGYTGDGGPATAAKLNLPEAVHLAPSGDVYIADTGNNVIRRVRTGNGIISTIAGTGVAGFSGDGGPAISAQLSVPRGLAIATSGF
jgi:sugar lactone lactonase YvrE